MARFLFITTKTTWGGSEPLWCEAAGRALAEGHRVTVVLPQVGKLARPVEELAAQGAKVVMRPPRARPTFFRRLEWKAKRIREPETQWWRSQLPEAFDAICVSQGGAYCVMNMPGLVNWLEAYIGKHLLLCQSTRVPLNQKPEVRSEILNCYANASKVGFTASSNQREMEIHLASKISNAYMHQNPMDFSILQPVDWSESEVPLITCPSRLFIQDKGQDILFQVLAERPWSERKFRLQLFGEGPDAGYLQELAAYLGIEKKLEFCGHTAGMFPIWKKTQLMVLPSRSEGLPLVLVGAMAAGRPCVVTDVGGNAEWVRDGIDGFVARMPNVWSVNEALERAWQGIGNWKEMGQHARQRFLELHPKDPVGDLLGEMLAISKSNGK